MTPWTFNLRSNDSDLEDEEETISPLQSVTALDTHPQHDDIQRTRQMQTNKELEELFGTTEDEESVEYKPNPWSIARINANSRNVAPVTKPKPKKTWRPANNSGSKSSGPGLERFWKNPRGLPKDGCGTPSETVLNARNKPLRDSISEALRRGGPTTTVFSEQGPQPRARASVAGGSGNLLNSQLTDTSRLQGSDQSPLGVHQKPILSRYNTYELGAYIPDNSPNIPIFNEIPPTAGDHEHPGTPNGSLSGDRYILNELMTPAQGCEDTNTPDDNSYPSPYQVCDEALSSIGFVHTPTHPPPDSQRRDTSIECMPNRFRTASPEPGLDWISQNQVRLASPYSDGHNRDSQVPSPTVELIARFTAPKPNELGVFERSK
ncbi:hypothetical protein FRC11_004312, partial [Ceratobasidium sp. 423]